ncbi:MAG: hypothetical protein AB1626_05390 [Candidatus Micrarchaeota archaeon]
MGYKDLGHDFESSVSDEEEEESKEQYWEDEYEDREGENTAATAEDRFLELKNFKCRKCGRTARQRATFLFKPMCCGMQMSEFAETEKKTGFKHLVKKAAAKAKKAARKAKKPVRPQTVKKARKPVKAKRSKARKTKKIKARAKKRRR